MKSNGYNCVKNRHQASSIFVLVTVFLLSTSLAFAQQNLFNIPSGDITPQGKLFYQHQLNVYSSKLESKGHFVYGLGGGWDAGVNVVGKGFYFTPEWQALYNDKAEKGATYPVIMGTVQKQFVVSPKLHINIGTQAGVNVSNRLANKEFNYFAYTIGSYHFMKGSRVVGGIYQTNRMFVGTGNTFGYLAGYELKLTKRLYLMGDWVSGNNDGSVAVLGGMYNLSKRVQLCAGWLVPNPETPKPSGLVLEFNLLGWDLWEDEEEKDVPVSAVLF
jgi:hypothetical protein